MKLRWGLLLAVLAAASGCDHAPTAPTLVSILLAKSQFDAHNLTRYAYVYESLYFFSARAGHQYRLVVLNDSVVSAQDVATDSILPSAAGFPTLDQLFDGAKAALAAGTLTRITFDPTFGFPTRMDIAGPPDASGSILASGLELLP